MVTRRNVPGYPPHSINSFATRAEAVEYYKKVVVETPRVSLGSKTPDPLPTIEDYTRWLIGEGLYDPLLNPDAPIDKDQ